MPTAPTPFTYAPPILWAAARALNHFALFGEPARIAAQHTHRQSERTLLLKWLRAGEAHSPYPTANTPKSQRHQARTQNLSDTPARGRIIAVA